MIKNFETYINEDYFSKLAGRKDIGNVRKENEITEDFVRSFVHDDCEKYIRLITIRKENGKTIVDVDGSFVFREDIEEIPFQFGKVTHSFACRGCSSLKSLVGCPREVGGYFSCKNCTNLTSIEGCPEEVGGDFECHNCKNLKSLEGCPEKVGGAFYCWNCAKNFTDDEVKSMCKVGGEIMC